MKISPLPGLWSSASKIHQPLPLNPRESQKLLSVLKASFRKQLDQEHPVTSSGSPHDVHHHLHSVLTNPLFNVNTRRRRLSSKSRMDGNCGRLQDAQRFDQRPMDHFKEQVATGTATLDTATQYLQAQYIDAVASSDPKAANSLRSSANGSIVLSWLWSSGLEGSNTFLFDHKFVAAIMPFIVAEGHQTIAWRWYRRLQTAFDVKQAKAASDLIDLARSTANVLLQLVKSELHHGGGLDAGMKCLLRCTEDGAFASPVSTESYVQSSKTCWPATRYLAQALVHRSPGTVPDVALYNDIVQRIGTWAPSCSNVKALLLLHHPVKPDWAPALHCLRSLSPKILLTARPRLRRWTLQLCLDSAGLLLSQGRQVDAVRVMELAQKSFPGNFIVEECAKSTSSTVPREETSQQSDEASNLQLLEALAAH